MTVTTSTADTTAGMVAMEAEMAAMVARVHPISNVWCGPNIDNELRASAKPMTKISFTRQRGAPFRLSEEERKRLENVDDATAATQALKDPDNPPLTDQQLNRMALAPGRISVKS